MQALEWYREKFSSKGNVSSLEAKCAISISRIYLERGELVPAIEYADMAILIFERTCGSDSPLVASALRVRGDILWAMPEKETRISARETYLKAFRIEAQKDSVDLVALIEINTAIVDTFIKPKVGENSRPEIVRSQFRPVLEIALTASEHARRKCPRDGNLGALFKIFAELAIWAEEFHISKSLLEEANILFSEEKSLDCSHIIQKCNELMKLIDDRDR
jgi:hypothetical protein